MKKILSSLILLALTVGFVVSCTTTNTGKSNVSFRNTRWGLMSLNGKKVDTSLANKEIYVIFKINDTALEGFAGCNGFGGQYEANIDGTMKISKMVSTMMACPAMEIETQFTQALESATTYKISGDELIMYSNGKEVVKLYAVYLR